MKAMSARISALAAAAVLVAGLAAADIRVLAVSGIVRVTPPGSMNFSQAVRGMVLPEGTQIVTTESGRVQIEVSAGNIVSLHANTQIKIASAKPRASGFQLLAGRLKGVFNRLASDERFEVQFSNSGAVASVKGTTLAAEQNGDTYRLLTIYGEVELKDRGHSVFVPQGTVWNGVRLEALSEEEIHDALNETSNEDAAHKRGELHSFVNEVKTTNEQNQDVVTQVHENDFAVGRTLRDVHGNLARVEQILARPDGASIQFVNLVKRESYEYHGKFAYHGSNGPRFDYLEGFVTFNQPLPDSIGAWAGFFSTHKDVEAKTARITLANGPVSDPNRDVLSRTYDVSSNHTNNTSSGVDSDTFTFNGQTLTVHKTASSNHQDGGDELWATSVGVAYRDTNGNGILDTGEQTYNMNFEGYAIDQDGKVLTLNSIMANGSQDPIGYAKTLAGEGIISIVDANTGADAMRRGNIDLIFIPDIIIAIATKYAPSLGSVSTSGN